MSIVLSRIRGGRGDRMGDCMGDCMGDRMGGGMGDRADASLGVSVEGP